MKPNWYIDFTVDGDAETSLHALLPQVYRVLHGAFGKSANNFAVAFPNSKPGYKRTVGNTIRVFSSSLADIEWLTDNVKGHFILRDYAKSGPPLEIPHNYAGKWATWTRIRVQKKEGVNRSETIARARQNPYFEVISSSGNGFGLRICKTFSPPQSAECHPNSYGLASGGDRKGVGRNLFSLPDF